MQNKPILIIGPPRSGTSITAKIIQAHIGGFPFEINRHGEPKEMVEITDRLLERNDMTFKDRLYPATVNPDKKFFDDTLAFFGKYKDMRCVIKEPIWTAFYKWIYYHKIFNYKFDIVFVYSNFGHLAKSLIYHKKFNPNIAELTAQYWAKEFQNILSILRPSFRKESILYFDPKYKNYFKCNLEDIIRNLGMKFNEKIFNELWDNSQIQNYRK